MSYSYRCGPTAAAITTRTSWGPASSPPGTLDHVRRRPLSGHFDRIFNAFERTNAFRYLPAGDGRDDVTGPGGTGHADVIVNRRKSSSFERADCSLAAHAPSTPLDDDHCLDKMAYAQQRQLFPLQEDLADWINKTIGITYLTGENFLDVLDNGVELCQLAAVIHDTAERHHGMGLDVGHVPQIRGRCWQRAARRSFFSRDNTENFITFCRELGVHENLLFESDDLVLHKTPRQVIICLLEVARLATRFDVEPPGLVQLEREIALEERDSGLDSATSGAVWQFRDVSPPADKSSTDQQPASTDNKDENREDALAQDALETASNKSEGTVDSTDSDVPLKPTNDLDKRVQLVTRLLERGCSCDSSKCSKLLKVKKVGEGRYNIAGRNVFIRLLKGRHMMVRVGGGWDTLEHFLSRHEPCQVRLVTQGRRDVLPLSAPPRTAPALSPATSKESSIAGTVSPPSSISGKVSPIDRSGRSTGASSKLSSGKSSPDGRRTSTPTRPASAKPLRSALTLTLNKTTADSAAPVRTRKQSAPASFSTPSTPTSRTARTPPNEHRKSFASPSSLSTPKKTRSMSLVTSRDERKPFCGTERLNQARKAASTPVPSTPGRKVRSASLASTPVHELRSFSGADRVKTRSMSLAAPAPGTFRPLAKSVSVSGGGAMTQAAIEESIRHSLEATIANDNTSKPFLHIKAKYRSPPPREVPPR